MLGNRGITPLAAWNKGARDNAPQRERTRDPADLARAWELARARALTGSRARVLAGSRARVLAGSRARVLAGTPAGARTRIRTRVRS